MNIFLHFDFNKVCSIVVNEVFTKLEVNYKMERFGEIEFSEKVSDKKFAEIVEKLNEYGIEIVENHKSVIIQKIKDTIHYMVFKEENLSVKSSVYLAEKLDLRYGFISKLFSEITYTSIENYIILQKTDYAKQLLIASNLTLTEIAFKLNYSSAAHFSTQFKNTTGITPSAFQRIISKRRAQKNDSNFTLNKI
jgi:AraC-like DNA-binding protein